MPLDMVFLRLLVLKFRTTTRPGGTMQHGDFHGLLSLGSRARQNVGRREGGRLTWHPYSLRLRTVLPPSPSSGHDLFPQLGRRQMPPEAFDDVRRRNQPS